MAQGSALWILPATLGFWLACESQSNPDLVEPPSNNSPDGRWVRVEESHPDTVPYLFSSLITVHGEGFDGIRSVILLDHERVRFGVIENLTSTRVTFRTPEPNPRWSTVALILSETPDRMAPEPWHQSDMLRQAISFVGPVPEDTLIYEFRYPSLDGGRVVRWDLSDFPLKVWIAPEIPRRIHESLWFGILAWEDLLAPGAPSFTQVDSFEHADVRWTAWGPVCGTRWIMEDDRFKAEFSCPLEKYQTLPLDILTNVAAHDTGHILGIHNHSHRRSDIMGPSLDYLDQGFSEADIGTLRALYSMPVSSLPVP
ncbi:MAG: matrixin family metalloprotease [Gemmatimonadota bacterium]